MLVSEKLRSFIIDLYSSTDRVDVKFVEQSWTQFVELNYSLQNGISLLIDFLGSAASQRRNFLELLQIGEVIALDFRCSKQLLDTGFLIQSAAMLRPAMETGLTLSIVVSRNQLDEWILGREIKIPIKTSNHRILQKKIDQCTYGNLLGALELIVSDLKSTAGERPNSPNLILELIESVLSMHSGFRESLDANKYIHKSRDVVNFQRRLIRNYVLVSNSSDQEHKQIFAEGLLDLRFELLITQIRSLASQVASRYIELILLIEFTGLVLEDRIRDMLTAIGERHLKTYNDFEKNLLPLLEIWEEKQRNLQNLP